jgi:two-component system sensor histidine kinase DesK
MACLAASIDGQATGMWALYTGVLSAEFIIDRPARQAWRHVVIIGVTHVLAVTATLVVSGQSEVISLAAPFSAGVIVFMAYALGTTFRQWEAALRLDEARRAAADLATTRERLRLAEDLHDILGHALEVVSLKSELAVRLSDLDPAKSKEEMIEVQRLARGALKDVRELAHGRRPTDLGTELTGARHLLESAGITCHFAADPAKLTDPERELFGRILREAVTNALRHADPRTFTVALKITDQVEFRVVNDGVPAHQAGDGTGLKSLARRVTEAGGEFTAGPRDDRFEVRAVVPR